MTPTTTIKVRNYPIRIFLDLTPDEKVKVLSAHFNMYFNVPSDTPVHGVSTTSGKSVYNLRKTPDGSYFGYVHPPRKNLTPKLRHWNKDGSSQNGNSDMDLIVRAAAMDLTVLDSPKPVALWFEPVRESPARSEAAPEHYAGKVTPWDLQQCMKSSGHAFVDARRTDAIEYAFRIKEDMREDLLKAIHCLKAAVQFLDANTSSTETTKP